MTESDPAPQRQSWRVAMRPYARPHIRRALVDLATALVPYLALTAAMMLLLMGGEHLLALVLVVPAAGFQTRTFLVMHDCAHGSFLPGRRANHWLGIVVGLLTMQTFHCWRHDHIRHHASGGDLAADGTGDVEIITVSEFQALSARQRARYRLRHHPLIVFGVGAFLVNAIKPRIPRRTDPIALRWVKLATDLVLAAMFFGLAQLVGWGVLLVAVVPMSWLAATFGGWLIWVQHRYEGAQWQRSPDWEWETAALVSSSHLALPHVLRYFSLNIGLHHVHHLNPRIPNYSLRRANDENDFLSRVPRVSLRDGLRAVCLSLYDTESQRLVSFAEARMLR